jgi:hypothetical protein
MTAPQPVRLRYEGEGQFVPASPHWGRIADKDYTIGEVYNLEPREDRSMGRHRAFFAQVNEAFANLPESVSNEQWALSPDHLRKYALIRTGFCNSQIHPCGTRAEALRLQAILKPIDEFSIVEIRGTTVTRYVALSQDIRSMDKAQFNASAEAVLDWIAKTIGVERAALDKAAA